MYPEACRTRTIRPFVASDVTETTRPGRDRDDLRAYRRAVVDTAMRASRCGAPGACVATKSLTSLAART